MEDPYLRSVLEAIAEDAADAEGPRLISVDELRAAGALDVPAGWRKSLGGESDDLFSELAAKDEGADHQEAINEENADSQPLPAT